MDRLADCLLCQSVAPRVEFVQPVTAVVSLAEVVAFLVVINAGTTGGESDEALNALAAVLQAIDFAAGATTLRQLAR